MAKQEYFIESVSEDENESDMKTAYISSTSHSMCIKVYGKQVELTDRLIGIIKGLNGEK